MKWLKSQGIALMIIIFTYVFCALVWIFAIQTTLNCDSTIVDNGRVILDMFDTVLICGAWIAVVMVTILTVTTTYFAVTTTQSHIAKQLRNIN